MIFYSEMKFSVKLPVFTNQVSLACMYSNNIVGSQKNYVPGTGMSKFWWYLNNLQWMHALIWAVLHDANFFLTGWKKIIHQNKQNIPASSQNYVRNVNIKIKLTLNKFIINL